MGAKTPGSAYGMEAECPTEIVSAKRRKRNKECTYCFATLSALTTNFCPSILVEKFQCSSRDAIACSLIAPVPSKAFQISPLLERRIWAMATRDEGSLGKLVLGRKRTRPSVVSTINESAACAMRTLMGRTTTLSWTMETLPIAS
jgi:hypothetical protein